MKDQPTKQVSAGMRSGVTATSELLITAEEFDAGSVGILSMQYVEDGMRQVNSLSSKVVFSRGIAGEVCVISIEPACNPNKANRAYLHAGFGVPVTFVTVAITGDVVRYLDGKDINTSGDYIKYKGELVTKKGAGYGVKVGTADVDTVGIVVSKIVRSSLSADYGRAVADPKAWMPNVASWRHDARFINGGDVTGASKNVVKLYPRR
jgi:hypothetical protein